MPIDSGKSHVYIIICRATAKETIQGDILGNTINKSRWNTKNTCCQQTYPRRTARESFQPEKNNKRRNLGVLGRKNNRNSRNTGIYNRL